MHIFRPRAVLALALAAPLGLAACQPPPEPPPQPKPAPRPPTVTSMAVEGCEAAVLAAFRESPAHRRHDLVFDPAQRKSIPIRTGQLSVTGGGSYASDADKLVRVTYACTYDVRAERVVTSGYR